MRRPALVVLLLAALCSALQASERSADPQLLRPGSSLTNEQRLDWAVGRSFTHKPWVSAPATTTARDGLGHHTDSYPLSANSYTFDGRDL